MNDFNALTETRHGTFCYNRHDIYIGKSLEAYGEYSEGEVDLFSRLVGPNSVVLDVGANFGCFTVPLAQMAKHVYAFEPSRLTFQALCANVALNSLSNVTTYNAGCGAESGTIQAPEYYPDKPNNIGGIPCDGSITKLPFYKAPCLTIDSLNLKPDFIKIDVEGMEAEVLRGAAETLKAHRPTLYVENDRRDKSKALIDYLWELGYDLYWHLPPFYNPDNWKRSATKWFETMVSINMLCLPGGAWLPSGYEGLKKVE